MSDELQTAATIASLRAEVERLTDYAERLLAENVRLSNRQSMDRGEIESMAKRNYELREDLANARKWIDGQDVRSDFPNATAMRQALDTARERAGVLEAEVRAWHAAEHLRKDEPHNEFMRLAEARARTRETNALDAAKFGGA